MASDVLEQLVTEFVFKVNESGLLKYERAQKRINKNTKQMIGLNSTLAKGLKRLFVGAGAVMGFQSLVNTYRDLDLVRRSIEGLTKSTQDWDYIQKEALRTGTGIDQVAKGYRNFYSAASMAGFDKTGIQDMYSDVLTASRAIGATQQQVGGALLALEQMLSKGKVSMEELRRQLGNALPGAFEIGAKAMGVTTQKFNDMVKKGISAAEFVPKFTKELLNTYKEAFPEAIKSLDFALVNLSTSWKLFQYEIMNGKAGEGLAETINSITEFLRSPEAITVAKGIGQALNMVAKALGFAIRHIKLLLLLFGISQLSKLPMLLINVEWGLIKICSGFKKLGVASFLLSKSFLWVTIIAAALYGVYLLIQDIYTYIKHPEWESFTKDLAEKFPIIEEMIKDIKKTTMEFLDNLKPTLESLGNVIKDFITVIMEYVRGKHPLLTGALKILLSVLTAIMWTLTQIIKLFNFLNSSKTITSPKIPDVTKAEEGFKQASEIRAYNPTFRDKVKSFFTPKIPQFSDRYYGGMDLNKTSNETTNINNNQKIVINAANRSDAEILALVRGAMNDDYDKILAMTNQTPSFLGYTGG